MKFRFKKIYGILVKRKLRTRKWKIGIIAPLLKNYIIDSIILIKNVKEERIKVKLLYFKILINNNNKIFIQIFYVSIN